MSTGPTTPARDDGDFGLRIGRDGTWYYHDSPIRRLPLAEDLAIFAQEILDRAWRVAGHVRERRGDTLVLPGQQRPFAGDKQFCLPGRDALAGELADEVALAGGHEGAAAACPPSSDPVDRAALTRGRS